MMRTLSRLFAVVMAVGLVACGDDAGNHGFFDDGPEAVQDHGSGDDRDAREDG